MTRDDVLSQLGTRLGPLVPAQHLEAATDAVLAFAALPDDAAREAAADALREFFCLNCGSTRLPCYCERDD